MVWVSSLLAASLKTFDTKSNTHLSLGLSSLRSLGVYQAEEVEQDHMDWAPGAKAGSVPFSGGAQRVQQQALGRAWREGLDAPILLRTLLLFEGFSVLSDSLLMRLMESQALEGPSLPISCESRAGTPKLHLICSGLPTARTDPGGKKGIRDRSGLECDFLAYLKSYLLSSKAVS